MIVKSHLGYANDDQDIHIQLSGESSHENTLLELIANRELFGHSTSESAGSDSPTATHLNLTFRTKEKK